MPAPPNLTPQWPNPQGRQRPLPDLADGGLALERAPYVSIAVVQIAGATATSSIRLGSIRIEDHVNQPKTCTFRMDGTAPTTGQDIKIGLGDFALDNLLFAGVITGVSQLYEGQK